MARKLITFIAMIAREGSSGSVRGKIPAGLVKAIDAKEGDGVEFQVHGSTLVGAQVLTGRALRDALKEKKAEAAAAKPAPAKRKVAPAKTVSKQVGRKVRKVTSEDDTPVRAKKVTKKPLPAKKAVKRRTRVEYEEDEAPRVVKKKGRFAAKVHRR